MYAFQTQNSSRKKIQRRMRLLLLLVFLLALALGGMTLSYRRQQKVAAGITEALNVRAFSEADAAQTAVYRLTQSSGTNTMSLLSAIRSHIYALQCLNTMTASIYGADNYIAQPDLLEACTATLDNCENLLAGGRVLTTETTQLRDQVNAVAALFGLQAQ